MRKPLKLESNQANEQNYTLDIKNVHLLNPQLFHVVVFEVEDQLRNNLP